MSTPTWRRRLIPLGVIALLGLTYLATVATFRVSNDVRTTSLMSWRIAQTGSAWFDGFDYSPWEDPGGLWIGEAANGHIAGFRSPGPVAAGVVSYLVMRLIGLDAYSFAPGSVTAALLTTTALGLIFYALRTRLSAGVSGGAVLALGLTTPIWSVSADSLWTHPVTLLGIAGMAWAAARDRWWLVGLFGGVALWGRLHTVLIVAILGVAVAVVRRRPQVALQAGVVSGLGLGLALLWGKWMYGTWSPAGGYSVSGYTERATSTSSPFDTLINHLGLWVAPDRGILVWTPVLLVLLPAVLRGWRDLPDWSRWLALGGVAYTVVQGQLNGFSGGSGFYGYRLTLELLVCIFPAYALSLAQAGRWARLAVGPLLGLQFAAISLGALGDGAILNENFVWTHNSFLALIATTPALIMWPILTMSVGVLAGQLVQRRSTPVSKPAERAESQIAPGDQVDGV